MALPPLCKAHHPPPGSYWHISLFQTYPYGLYNDLEDDIEPRWIFQNTVYLRVPNLITSVTHIPGIRCEHHWGAGQGVYTLITLSWDASLSRDQLANKRQRWGLKLWLFWLSEKFYGLCFPLANIYAYLPSPESYIGRFWVWSQPKTPRKKSLYWVPRMAALGFLSTKVLL